MVGISLPSLAARQHLRRCPRRSRMDKEPGQAENALRSRPRDDDALKDEQIKRLKQKVGELVLDLDILQEATKGRPFARTTSDE